MTINNVIINNWEPPGEEWWDNVELRPSEPLIMATMEMTLSWDEYKALLQKNKQNRKLVIGSHECAA